MVTVNIQVESTPLADGFKTRALSSLVFVTVDRELEGHFHNRCFQLY